MFLENDAAWESEAQADRLVTCSATTQQWAHLSSSLKINQSLTCLNLTANELPEESAKSLLENCHLTEACCKELSSALIINQRLMHLCLAKNALGDGSNQSLVTLDLGQNSLGYSRIKMLCDTLKLQRSFLWTL
ncbi:hypothetical protein GH733_017281, partial [Mirounga leonina]